MIPWRSACRRHRAALVDLVDRGERDAATPAALDHLDRCARCEAELTEIALTVAALRRAGRQVRAASPPRPARSAILGLARPAPAHWRPRLALAGLVTSAALVAVITGPQLAPGAGLAPAREPPYDAFSTYGVVVGWRTAELRIAWTTPVSVAATPAEPDTIDREDARSGSVPRRVPDRLLWPLVEVPSAESTPRAPQPV